MEGGRSMKKLLLVVLFVAIPALVLAQGTTTTTKAPEASKAKVGSTTTTNVAKPTEAVKKTPETKATETKQAVTEPTKTTPTPEMILIGEIVNVDDTNKTFTLKVKETNKEERISFKSTDPLLKQKAKVRVTYEKDNTGKLWLKSVKEHAETK
jgi:hypothetical protein